tara:strand:- start:12173 stop:13435 length:1263 start_codon:yes stop_codon:yes gene_type:complete
MIKIIKLFVYLLIFIIPIVWLSNYPGEVNIIWKGYLIETSFFFMITFILIIIFIVNITYRILFALRSFPKQYILKKNEKNLNLARETLENISYAWIGNDSKGIDIQARKLKKYTGDSIFSTLILAQRAMKNKEYGKSLKFLEILERNEKSKFIAFKCKAMVFVKQNKKLDAQRYLKKAFDINSMDPWICDNLSVLLAKSRKWQEAAKTLEKFKKNSELSSKRVGYLLKSGADPIKTYEISDESIPVVVNVLKHYLNLKNEEKVHEILRKTWKKLRYFGLIQAIFAETKYDIKLALKRYRLVYKALKNDLGSNETKIAMAFAALNAKLWEKSRSFLVSIDKSSIDSRVMTIWNELSEKSDRIKAPKVEKKLSDPPYWFCSSCNLKQKNWNIYCENCDTIGTIKWSKSTLLNESKDLINNLF